jgi:hypothetical protein
VHVMRSFTPFTLSWRYSNIHVASIETSCGRVDGGSFGPSPDTLSIERKNTRAIVDRHAMEDQFLGLIHNADRKQTDVSLTMVVSCVAALAGGVGDVLGHVSCCAAFDLATAH